MTKGWLAVSSTDGKQEATKSGGEECNEAVVVVERGVWWSERSGVVCARSKEEREMQVEV